MTFYDVIVYGSKIAGRAGTMSAVIDALKIVDKWYAIDPTMINNPPTCEECKTSAPYDGRDALWHSLIVREQIVHEIERAGDFVWTKKKGIGRRQPREYLDEIVATGQETWFTLTIYEV